MIDWTDLNETVTRFRSTTTVSARGQALLDWTTIPPQAIQATIQPYLRDSGRGVQRIESEGMITRVSNVMYCNFVVSGSSGQVTDLQAGDRIVDTSGQKYRVEAVVDDGGLDDHIKAVLTASTPSGD